MIVKIVKIIWNHNLDGHCTRLKYYVRRKIATLGGMLHASSEPSFTRH